MEKRRVLLADDHAIIRDGVRQILSDTEDLEVAGEAANGIEVMQRIREGVWHVLVLDISMPGRGGIELIRMIRDERHAVPILVLSMHHEEQYAVRALKAGAQGYVTKESDADLLVGAIRKVANGGVFVSDKVAELMIRSGQSACDVAPHQLLSDREYQIFDKLVQGRGLSEIALELSLSVKTISTHKTHILQKMGLTNNAELVRYAISRGLVDPGQY